MEIEKVKITDIIPAEYNPRTISENELTKLTNSINEFGLVDPIIINLKNMHIIGGHQRYEALISQHMLDNEFMAELNLIQMGDIGWIFTETDLKIESEDHEKALNLALNKISGEWEFEKLSEILDDLSMEGFDIELTGFEDLEINERLPSSFDFDVELPRETHTNNIEGYDNTILSKRTYYFIPGEIWNLAGHELTIGELPSTKKLRIDIFDDEMQISIEHFEGEDPFKEFEKENENNKGLKPEGLRWKNVFYLTLT